MPFLRTPTPEPQPPPEDYLGDYLESERQAVEGPGRFARPLVPKEEDALSNPPSYLQHIQWPGLTQGDVPPQEWVDVAESAIEAAQQLAIEQGRGKSVTTTVEPPRNIRPPETLGGGRPRDVGVVPDPNQETMRQGFLNMPGAAQYFIASPVIAYQMAEGAATAFSEMVDLLSRGASPSDPEVVRRSAEVAGLAMSGSMFGVAPKGALRSGAARPARPPGPPEGRVLDTAGFYSQAEEVARRLPEQGNSGRMWAAFERAGIKEPEIRQLNLDAEIGGDVFARARRGLQDLQAEQQRITREYQQLSDPDGQVSWIERNLPGEGITPATEARARARHTTLGQSMQGMETRIADAKEHLKNVQRGMRESSTQLSRDDIIRTLQGRSARILEDTHLQPFGTASTGGHSPLIKMISQLQGGIPEGTLNYLQGELQRGGVSALRESAKLVYGMDPAIVDNAIARFNYEGVKIPRVATHQLERPFANATLDPQNPTTITRTLRLDQPNPSLDKLWKTIPPEARDILRQSHRADVSSLSLAQQDIVFTLRDRYRDRLNRITNLEDKLVFRDPHFEQGNILGHYTASLQKGPDGQMTLTPSQFQSNWAADIARGLNVPKHPLVSSVTSWLDPVLRRVVKDAVDQGVGTISIPSFETVTGYNMVRTDAQRALYDEIAPRRMRAILRELDPNYRIEPTEITTLQSHDGRTLKGKWLQYELTPDIVQHHQEGRGMRLSVGGVHLEEGD